MDLDVRNGILKDNPNELFYYLIEKLRINGLLENVTYRSFGTHTSLLKITDDPEQYCREIVDGIKNKYAEPSKIKRIAYQNLESLNNNFVEVNIGHIYLNEFYKLLSIEKIINDIYFGKKVNYDPVEISKYLLFTTFIENTSFLRVHRNNKNYFLMKRPYKKHFDDFLYTIGRNFIFYVSELYNNLNDLCYCNIRRYFYDPTLEFSRRIGPTNNLNSVYKELEYRIKYIKEVLDVPKVATVPTNIKVYLPDVAGHEDNPDLVLGHFLIRYTNDVIMKYILAFANSSTSFSDYIHFDEYDVITSLKSMVLLKSKDEIYFTGYTENLFTQYISLIFDFNLNKRYYSKQTLIDRFNSSYYDIIKREVFAR